MVSGSKKASHKDIMWERLSARRESLNLDDRGEEEPEDYFVRMCSSGNREVVIQALKENLYEVTTQTRERSVEAEIRFLQRALRLCDLVAAQECKPSLQYILLYEKNPRWGKQYQSVRELAARALEALPKNTTEFQYWKHVAASRDAILPYALNALLEIDLDRGIADFLSVYFDFYQQKRLDEVDWRAILEIAADTHGKERLSHMLDKHLAGNPDTYEYFVSGMSELSKRGRRSLPEIACYSGTPPHSRTENVSSGMVDPIYPDTPITKLSSKSVKPPDTVDYISSLAMTGVDDSIYLMCNFVPPDKAYLLGKNR